LVEYFEGAGLDTLSVDWSATGMPRQSLANATLSSAPFNYTGETVTPAPEPDPVVQPPVLSSGLAYDYYEGTWTSLPDFAALTPISSGTTAQFTLPPSNGVLFYGYRFRGKIFIEQSDIFTFFTASNDGSQLRIDGVLVVDNNGKHAVLEKQGSIELTAGYHDIELTYFQSNGSEALDVYWSGTDLPKQIIDASVLFAP